MQTNPFSKEDFDKMLTFLNFLNKFRNIKRIQRVTGEDRNENDAEHSYILTMYVWYCYTISRSNLDLNKILQYTLVHDLVETYAGDTYVWDEKAVETKVEREHQAFLKIKDEFAEFPEMILRIEEYENKANKEVEFVFALDKTIDAIQFFLRDGDVWKELNVPYANQDTLKVNKIKTTQPALSIHDHLHDTMKTMGLEKFFTS